STCRGAPGAPAPVPPARPPPASPAWLADPAVREFIGVPRWETSAMDRQGTLSVCAAAITTPIVRAPCASSPAATPSPSPSPVASGSPGASPVASVASCADTDLDASITKWDGAAGSQIATITVKNIGGDTCVLGAPTAEQLLDGLGQLPVTSTGDKAVGGELTLASDKSAQLLVRVANWCTSAPSDKVSIGVTL